MPVYLEPNKTFPVCLKSDEAKPIETRPVFMAKAQSMRGQLRISETLDLWNEPGLSVVELFNRTLDVLADVFCGWKNIPGEFSRDGLLDTINYSEARELLRLVLYASQLDTEAKKD